MRVPDNAGFDPGMEIAVTPKQIAFINPIRPLQKGYIYIWVSNESENNKVWFDDLKVTHRSRRVTQATDYYAYGSVLREQKTPEELTYRYKYQGQYAEKDEETGWSHFELREYDPVVGRWTSKDPKGQFYSPYLGMGNNPIISIDPDGGYSKQGARLRNFFNGGSGAYQSGEDGGKEVWGYNKSGTSYFGKDARSSWKTMFAPLTEVPQILLSDMPEFGNKTPEITESDFASSTALLGSSIGLLGSMKYSSQGGWIGQNGIRYSLQYFGRYGSAPGLQSQALKLAQPLKQFGKIGYLGFIGAGQEFQQGNIRNGILEAGSTSAGLYGGPLGAGWSVGWEIGRLITKTETYQDFKYWYWHR